LVGGGGGGGSIKLTFGDSTGGAGGGGSGFITNYGHYDTKDPNFNIFSQADNYRVKTKEDNKKIAEKIARTNKNHLTQSNISEKFNKVEDLKKDFYLINKDSNLSNAITLETLDQGYFKFDGDDYKFTIDLINEENINSLYSVNQSSFDENGGKTKMLICKINLAHPFFNRFEQFKKANDYEPIMAIFKSFALAEFVSTKRSIQYPSEMRTYFNEYIIEY
jgi:hypothetical protein